MSAKFDQFFDAFQSCNETRAALENGKLSTDKKVLRKRVIIPKKEVPAPEPIPSPFGDLLSIQGSDGRWQSKEDVFFILNIPVGSYFTNSMEEWEEATLFAIAKIRQHYDLFHLLGDAHDKAMEWIQSTKYIRSALDVINSFASDDGLNISVSTTSTCKRKVMKAPKDPYRETLERSSRFSYSRTMTAMRSMSMDGGAAGTEEMELMQRAAERARIAMEMLTPTLNYAALSERITNLKRTVDKNEARVVTLALKQDSLVRELEECVKRCVHIYKTAGLTSDRNNSFDELTASLGDDVPPRVGFDGWQRKGKSGYRMATITLFNSINDLAHSRLLLREAVQTAAGVDMKTVKQNKDAKRMKDLVDKILPDVKELFDNRDDWHLSWGGTDLVKHVIDSLDFLGGNPLLVNWYGTSYPFLSNPFAFSFPLEKLWPSVATDKQVQGYLSRTVNNARRSCRHLLSSRPAGVTFDEPEDIEDAAQSRKEDRIHRDAVISTQVILEELSDDIPVWWPKPTDLSDLNRVNSIFTAFLVLRLRVKMDPIEEVPRSVSNLTKKSAAPDGETPDIATEPLLATSESAPALTSGTAPLPNKKQVPPDFKSWLFTDDWYMSYGDGLQSGATHSTLSQRRSSAKKTLPGGNTGPRRRKVSGRSGMANRSRANKQGVASQNRGADGRKGDNDLMGGDLHEIMEGEAKAKERQENTIAPVDVDDQDDDLISVTEAPTEELHEEGKTKVPTNEEEVNPVLDQRRDSKLMRRRSESGSDTDSGDEGSGNEDNGDDVGGLDAPGSVFDDNTVGGQSAAAIDAIRAVTGDRDGGIDGIAIDSPHLVTEPPSAPAAPPSTKKPMGHYTMDKNDDSDSAHSSPSKKKSKKKPTSSQSRRTISSRGGGSANRRTASAGKPSSATGQKRPQSSSGSILTPLVESSNSKGTSLYESSKNKTSAAPTVKRSSDNDDNDSDSSSSPTKKKLTLKERKERRKESLSARLKAAGIEGFRKGSGKADQGGAVGGLPDIERKTKVSRTTSQDSKVKLTRRVEEPAVSKMPPVVKK